MSDSNDTIDFMLGVTETKQPVELLMSTYREIASHLVSYFMAGLGFLIAILLLVVGVSIVSALPLLPLLAIENQPIAIACMVLSGAVAAIGLTVISVVKAPCYMASMLIGVTLHHREGIPLALNTVWKHYPSNQRDVVLVYLGVQILTAIGVLFCVLPGLVLAFLTAYALPLVALYKMSPVEAIKSSISAVRAAPGWHLLFWLISGVSVMLFAWVPVLGSLLGQVVLWRLLIGASENTFGPPRVST
jgi:uncharacterized membrane protein